MKCEILEDNCGTVLLRSSHQQRGHAVKPLADAVPFSSTFTAQEDPLEASIMSLLSCQSPTAAEVSRLNLTYAAEREYNGPSGVVCGEDAI